MALDINREIASIRNRQGDNWLAIALKQIQDAHNQLLQTVAAIPTATATTTTTTPAATITPSTPSGVQHIYGGNAITITGTPQQPTVSASPATTTTEGVIKLAGDLGGTADLPTVLNLSNVTNNSLASVGMTVTGVTAGSYTNTDLTVDAEGRITAASNGTAASTDYVVASDGTIPTPNPLNDGAGNFIYVGYTP